MTDLEVSNCTKKTSSLINTLSYNGPSTPLMTDVEFKGRNGNTYKVLSDGFIHQGGESVLYKCICNNEVYVAKILNFSVSLRNDELRGPVLDFLIRHSGKDSHLLQLLDYGTIRYNDGRYDALRYIEIYPFCPKGDLGRLGKIDYDTLCEKVIPAINTALNTLHNANLVHRDVKPNNVYELDGEIYLGDFGLLTSSIIEDGHSNAHAYTLTQRGTEGYMAPEIYKGSVYNISDYYSFGQTISTLYHGKHMYEHLMNNTDYIANRDINLSLHRCMMEGILYLSLETKHKELDKLLRGLLKCNHELRFGYEHVCRWLTGDKTLTVPEDRNIDQLNPPFMINDVKCRNIESMVEQLLLNWDMAKEYLYEGIMKDFFSAQNTELSMKALEISRKQGNELVNNTGLSQFIHYLTEGEGIYWKGRKYNDHAEIFSDYTDNHSINPDVIELLSSGFLSWRMEELNKKDNKYQNQIELLKSIEKECFCYSSIGYHYARHKLRGEEISYSDCQNVAELIDYFIESFGKTYFTGETWLRDDRFYGFLMALGHVKIATSLFEEVRWAQPANAIRALFGTLEVLIERGNSTSLQTKKELLNIYLLYGPRSYLCWIKENLSCYDFMGMNAFILKEKIEDINLSNKKSLADIDSAFNELAKNLNQFKLYFCDNPILCKLGISNKEGNDIIYSKSLDGYFLSDFYGNKVPVGFYKYIDAYRSKKKIVKNLNNSEDLFSF
ncbi:MAG TPA: protein kinase [Clostridia bacterium]|jgi:serine/threonine protein kinase|nr:protein kinase [Clostridiaceae bacterium]HOF26476.1 protein kinase [Clostridia bacterium]HOM34064.1 protein kinase [Clostridia bacterium]HOR89643.1 protein kinase [Clostridia bacterium]HOT71402.1 protein kinase [Clostridia bacterium]